MGIGTIRWLLTLGLGCHLSIKLLTGRIMAQSQNVIFWGAGATAALGISTTEGQTKFIKRITGADAPGKSLQERIAEALGRKCAERWHDALFDLITILGDGDAAYGSISYIDGEQLDAMRRNWGPVQDDQELRDRIIALRLIYDWPALKSVVSLCPASSTDNFRLNDLFNLLDMHIPTGFGVRAPARQAQSCSQNKYEEQFFDARRLIGAKNALLVVLIALFYIDYQACLTTNLALLDKYRQFTEVMARRMQRRAMALSNQYGLDQPDFYQGDVGFVSLNYDPIILWMQFMVNGALNVSPDAPKIGSPPAPLHLFHDFGHLIPARRIGKGPSDWPWYPLNEGAAQRLNELKSGGDCKVRLTKFLFPHGCLCWRECPDCGKLSAYHGDKWNIDSPGLFPPPPLKAFDDAPCPGWISDEERTQRTKGKVDARQCLHCGTLTYAHHTQAVMQSSFKPRPPSFIEEIQRDLRSTTMKANHIIFMGYSLPSDDVAYRAFFSARRHRCKDKNDQPVRCTVVGLDKDRPHWYRSSDLEQFIFPEGHPVRAAMDIFGADNVRFYGGGIPGVFINSTGAVTDDVLENLLIWS